MSNIDGKALAQLKVFVQACQMNPGILHEPKLAFFREYLTSLGATIPKKQEEPQPAAAKEAPREQPKPEPSKIPTPEPTPEPMDDSSEEEAVEVDNSGVIEGEDLMDLPLGDPEKVPSEDEVDKANSLRGQAMSQMSDGNLDEAIKLFGEAVECNPQSAVLFAKRAQMLLRQKKPNNVLRDAEKALSLNPDNALAHKCKGKAYRLLGKWEEAALALAAGQKCDYDDDTQELLKTVVKPNAEKLRAARLKKETSRREKEYKAKVERAKSAKEARQKAYEEAKAAREAEGPGGMGGMGGMGGLFDDPEIATLLQDPEVVQAMADIQQNPGNMMKYMSNPKVMKVITKLQGKFAGMGGMPGGMGGMGGMGEGMPGGMGGMPGGMGGMPGGMGGMGGGMPGGMPGGFPGGFPGGMAGATGPEMSEPTRTSTNNANSSAPPPPFTATCDDVD